MESSGKQYHKGSPVSITSRDKEKQIIDYENKDLVEKAAIVFIPKDSIHHQEKPQCSMLHTLHLHAGKGRCFKCGGCSMTFDLVCELHRHLQEHGDSVSYFFDHITQTAFPKFGSSCKNTQTDSFMLNSVTNLHEPCVDPLQDVEKDDKEMVAMMKNDIENANHLRIKSSANCNPDQISYTGNTSDRSEADSDSEKQITLEDFMQNENKIVIENNHSEKAASKRAKRNRNVKPVTSLECQICSLNFKTLYALKVHTNREHLNKRLICEICSMELSTEATLKRHKLIHAGQAPYSCEICDKKYRTKAELNCHKTIHSEVKNFMCQFCGEAFASAKFLRFHIKKCQDLRPFLCTKENCGKSYRNKKSLLLHERHHTGENPFMCEFCGIGFTCIENLTKHMYKHTGERPWKCDTCQKTFTAKYHLQKHVRIHIRELPFVCHCGKAFTQNWNLKAHMRQHTGEKPYRCEVCGMSFKHNVSRKIHMKVHTDTAQS